MLTYKRPGDGISPDDVKKLINKKINKDIEDDVQIQWIDIN